MAEKNDLFEVIGSIFVDKEKFNEYSNLTLERNSFMINRMMSIQYPLQANALNVINANAADVVKSWAIFIPQQYKNPSFIYTKGSKKAQEDKSKKAQMPKKSEIIDYCLTYNISYKTVMDALTFFREDMITEINEFLKIKEQLK